MGKELERVVQVPLTDWLRFDEFPIRAKYLYYIRDEQNRMSGFNLNQSQRKLYDLIQERHSYSQEHFGYNDFRGITLKPRQVGFTTFEAVYNFDRSMFIDNFRTLVVSHNDKDQILIWQKYERIADYFPDIVEIIGEDADIVDRVEMKPTYGNFSDNRLAFSDKTLAEIYVRHAGSKDNIGKGDTVNSVHLSEAANYLHYSEVFSSLMQQLPPAESKPPEIHALIESTANGMTGAGEGFYREWNNNSKDWSDYKSGKTKSFSGFVPFFVHWFEIDKYKMKLIGGELYSLSNINFDPIDEKEFLQQEERLIEEEGVSLESINWYRYNIVKNCNRKLSDAFRYYPTYPEQAFQISSKSRFYVPSLIDLRKRYEDGEIPHMVGFLDDDLQFIPDTTGNLILRKMPDDFSMNRYYVGVDVSTGKEDGDFSVISVFDRLENRFVALWRDLIEEHLLPYEVLKLLRFFGYPKVNPEANLATLLNAIRPDGFMPYEGEIYVRGVNNTSGEPFYGTLTTGGQNAIGSRSRLISQYHALLEPEDAPKNYDVLLGSDAITEHIAFVRKTTGNKTRYEADLNAHDDIVMGNVLAYECAMQDYDVPVLDGQKRPDMVPTFSSIAKKTSQRKKIHGASFAKVGYH